MDYKQNLKNVLASFPLSTISGHEKFLAVATYLAEGKISTAIKTSQIKENWRKTSLSVIYNNNFYQRAQTEGWVNPDRKTKATFYITDDGLEHIQALEESDKKLSSEEIRKSGALIIVNKKNTHSFDKFLRGIMAAAKREVCVADSYVDASILDNILDVIPKATVMKLIYNNADQAFLAQLKRFHTQFPKSSFKRYTSLHDRFVIIDSTAYVLGPSIKDAAMHSPAIVVALGTKETGLLYQFFQELWKTAK